MIGAGPIGQRALIVWSLLAMALDIGVARITYGTILPALSRDLGLDYVTGGWLSTVNLAAYLAGTLAAPALGRRFGMRPLARWGHLEFAGGAALCGIASGVPLLGLGRVLMGFGSGVGLLALFVVVFGAVPPARRSLVSAVVWSGIGVAIVLSGAAAPWLLQPGGWWRLSFLLPAVVAVAVGISVGRNPGPVAGPAPVDAGRGTASHTSLRQHAPLAGAYFMFGVGYIAYSTFAGARLAAEAASMGVIVSAWLTLGAAAIIGAALTAAILSSPRLRHMALIAAALTGAAGTAAAGFGGPALSLLGSVLVGLGLAATPAIVTAYARERTSDQDYPRVFGFATVGLGAGQLLGPVVAGALAERFGPGAIMAFACAGYLAGCALALLDRRGAVRHAPVATGVSSREPHSAQDPS